MVTSYPVPFRFVLLVTALALPCCLTAQETSTTVGHVEARLANTGNRGTSNAYDSTPSPIEWLTLGEAIALAKEYSPAAIEAKHRFLAGYWQYRTYRAELLPSVKLTGSLPSFNKSLSRYQMPDGAVKFINEFSNDMGLRLEATQRVWFTGTELYVSSALTRNDVFGEQRNTTYLSTPLQVGIRQNIFGFNELRWQRKIEPLKYEQSKRVYLSDLEQIANRANSLFFQLVIAEQALTTSQLNYANADTLYTIAQGRFSIGTIAENELLQMELNKLTAQQAVSEAKLAVQLQRFKLVNYLGLREDKEWKMVVPSSVPEAAVNFDSALVQAMRANPAFIQTEVQRQQAKKNIAQARAQRGFEASIVASYGLTQQGTTIPAAYRGPLDQLSAKLGITVPLLDWGRGKGLVRMAKSNLELVESQVESALLEFRQELLLLVTRYSLQGQQLALAAKADTIALSRYAIAKQRYMVGKIDVLDLDKAQVDRDDARIRYLSTMQAYWQLYYELRRLTLHDPETGKPLEVDFEAIVKQ